MAVEDLAVPLLHGRGQPRAVLAAEIEAGLRRDVGVPPAVEDDARDVAPGIEAGATEQVIHVGADFALVVEIGLAEQQPAADAALGVDVQPRRVKGHVEGHYRRLVGVPGNGLPADLHRCADAADEAEAVVPAPGTDAETVQEAPVVECHVGHEHGAVMELAVVLADRARHVGDDPARHLAAGGDHRGACPHLFGAPVSQVGDPHPVVVVPDVDGGGPEPHARRRALAVEGGKVDPAEGDVPKPLAGDGIGNQVLGDVAGIGGVASRKAHDLDL